MKHDNEIFVFSPFSYSEIQNPKFGGSRLIFEQLAYFRDKRLPTHLITLDSFSSPISCLCRLFGVIRRRNWQDNSSYFFVKVEKTRWFLNLLYVLLIEFLSRLDYVIKIQLKNEVSNAFDSLILYNYPFGLSVTSSLKSKAKITIYEHNVEWKFFEDKLGGIFCRPLTWLLRIIELNNLKEADSIGCANKKDLNVLIEEGINPNKIRVWIPLLQRAFVNTETMPKKLKERLRGKYVVGFVGSNFEPNIVAVKNILKIAIKIPDKFIFLIIGSVHKAFENLREIPPNVIFTGYVDDLDSHLALCDAFVNPKTTSDTGIETKMFDYLKFDKPVIVTEIGGSGFKFSANVIISDLKTIPSKLQEILLTSEPE